MILEAAVTEESTIMEPQLDTVLNMLHQQVQFIAWVWVVYMWGVVCVRGVCGCGGGC